MVSDTSKHTVRAGFSRVIVSALLVIAFGSAAADDIVAELGLQAADVPVRNLAGWSPDGPSVVGWGAAPLRAGKQLVPEFTGVGDRAVEHRGEPAAALHHRLAAGGLGDREPRTAEPPGADPDEAGAVGTAPPQAGEGVVEDPSQPVGPVRDVRVGEWLLRLVPGWGVRIPDLVLLAHGVPNRIGVPGRKSRGRTFDMPLSPATFLAIAPTE